MAKRRKVIRAGDLVSEAIYTTPQPRDGARTRAERSKITSEVQRKLNTKTSKRRMEMRIAANFGAGDLFVTLTFDDLHLPARREAALACVRYFLRLLRETRKARGDDLRYIYVLEGQHGEARYHFHIFINSTGAQDREDIESLWSYGEVGKIKYIERDGYIALAEYVTKERKPVGARSWVCSLNLKQPVIESSFVPDGYTVAVPPDAHVIAREERLNEWGSFQYVKYWLPLRVQPVQMAPRAKRKPN